jgi:hypothetical protein
LRGKRQAFLQGDAAATSRFPGAFQETGGLVNATLKSKCSLKGILLAGVVLLAGSALAASKGPLELREPATVAGTQLKTGTYTVQWDGSGDQVQVKIYQGKKEVASTSARVVTLDKPLQRDGILLRRNDDGTLTVTRINFGKKNFALEISGDGGGSGSAGASR